MKKIGLFFTGSLLCGVVVHAQLIDMIAGAGVQGQIAAQSANSLKLAMNAIQHNDLIARLNLLITDIRTRAMGNYTNLKKENFQYDFGSFDWDIGSVNDNQFYIELKNIDKKSCNKLVSAINEAVTVKINSFVKKDCDDLNSIQFIFN